MDNEKFVTELISICLVGKQWQVRERKSPDGRPKIHYPVNQDEAYTLALDLCAGQCKTLVEIKELFQSLKKPGQAFMKVVAAANHEGENRKQAGMAAASNHADEAIPDWSAKALEHVRACRLDEFTAEDVRIYAYQNGLPRPPDGRAWGAVIAKAIRLKYIERMGYSKAKAAVSHSRPMPLYKNLVYGSRGDQLQMVV